MKKIIKTTKRTKKPEFILDLTTAENSTDVFAAFGMAKTKAGKPMEEIELQSLIENHLDALLTSMFTWNNTVMLDSNGRYIKMNLNIIKQEEPKKEEKKPGFFKRLFSKKK